MPAIAPAPSSSQVMAESVDTAPSRPLGAGATGAAGPRTPLRVAAGVRRHYDLSNAFYALWLDSSMTYSCARWRPDVETLEEAQAAKFDLLLDLAAVGPPTAGTPSGGTVLDLGCGWGSGLAALAARGVARPVGITLSAEQAHLARRRVPGADVRVCDWQDLDPAARFDAIVSVGSMEHVAGVGMSAAGRAAVYRRLFERCAGWLDPGGRLVVQTITTGDRPLRRRQQRDVLFLLREIFPASRLPSLDALHDAAAGRFELVACRDDRLDYQRTLLVWLERLGQRRHEAVALVGEDVTARYERYLRVSAELFGDGAMGLCRLAWQRTDGGSTP